MLAERLRAKTHGEWKGCTLVPAALWPALVAVVEAADLVADCPQEPPLEFVQRMFRLRNALADAGTILARMGGTDA